VNSQISCPQTRLTQLASPKEDKKSKHQHLNARRLAKARERLKLCESILFFLSQVDTNRRSKITSEQGREVVEAVEQQIEKDERASDSPK
jgi:hypothetical protein